MTRAEFEATIREAKAFVKLYDDARQAFWVGYIEGIRRFFHGNGYEPQRHEVLSTVNVREELDQFRREEARGYKLGIQGLSFEEALKIEPVVLPARVPFVNHTLRYRQPVHPLDDRAKMLLRNKAKKLLPYSHPIILVPDVHGRRDDGTPVPITTLGQWLFGVPGFRGHITVVTKEDEIEINLALPEDDEIRKTVIDLIKTAAKKLGLVGKDYL